MNFSLGFIDESGLMNVTSGADWLRFGMGGHNIEVKLTSSWPLSSSSVYTSSPDNH